MARNIRQFPLNGGKVDIDDGNACSRVCRTCSGSASWDAAEVEQVELKRTVSPSFLAQLGRLQENSEC